MTPPVLCLIQARYNSTRLAAKMLQTLAGESLIERGHRIACEAFRKEHVVVACCSVDKTSPLADELHRIGATVYWYDGAENDVLGRFHACAHQYRWHPDSVLHRWTSDDPFKSVEACRRVAAGERLPVELGGEAFTLAQLDKAYSTEFHVYSGGVEVSADHVREHITYALFPTESPRAPAGKCWTIDTQADLNAARERIEAEMVALEDQSWDRLTRCAQ